MDRQHSNRHRTRRLFRVSFFPHRSNLIRSLLHDATVEAGLSRVSPVVLAAATTILGVIPLIQDAFWISMVLTIMLGLTFGTILTMILVPTLYATLYRIPSPKPAKA